MATLAAQLETDWPSLSRSPEAAAITGTDLTMLCVIAADTTKEYLGEVDGTDKVALFLARAFALQAAKGILQLTLSSDEDRFMKWWIGQVEAIVKRRQLAQTRVGSSARDFSSTLDPLFPNRRV